MNKTVGVIGMGRFGTTIAKLLSENVDVLVFSRRKSICDQINTTHLHLDVKLSERIRATDNLKEIADQCNLIFPVVPSKSFRSMMKNLAPHLKPHHFLIHATKGFDTGDIHEDQLEDVIISRKNVHTMSEVIQQESIVARVGCLAGPNLSKEILEGQPAATVIASPYDEVVAAGQEALKSRWFKVYGSRSLKGTELAGALKNVIAIGAGILGGLGMGQNIWAMLISRGMVEMINLAKALDIDSKGFLGVAGIGDLVATASSTKSRNYSLGVRIAKGETIEQIRANMTELAEGVRTIQVMKKLCDTHNIPAPITQTLYKVVFNGEEIMDSLEYLINYPYEIDVNFV